MMILLILISIRSSSHTIKTLANHKIIILQFRINLNLKIAVNITNLGKEV